MNDKKHNISSKQLMCFIISSQIGFGIVSLPSNLAEVVGHDGWISVLLSGLVYTFCLFIITKLLGRYRDKSILQINILLFGKFIGMLLNILFFLYICFAAAIGFRLFSEIIKITVLQLTPMLAISIFLFMPTVYIAFKGLKVISRFSILLFSAYIFTIIVLLLICKDGRFTFIMPFGSAGVNAIMKGMVMSGFSYLGIELTVLAYPYVRDKENTTKYAVFSNIFATIFFTIVVATSIIYTGETKLRQLAFPLFNIATSIRAPIIERIDLLFIMFWFPVLGGAAEAYFFSAYHIIDVVFKINDKKLPIFIFTIFIFLIGKLPNDLIDIFRYTNIIQKLGMGVIIFLIFCYLFSFINKRGVKQNESIKKN